jgi:hypothetical protein
VETYLLWEKDRAEPSVRFYPAIYHFLGYDPFPPATTLAERITTKGRELGLPIRQAAKLAGVDEGTFSRWESGEWKPRISQAKVDRFLATKPPRSCSIWSEIQSELGNTQDKAKKSAAIAVGRCLCGKVLIEIGTPAFWAWHDHSRASQRAHGAACATYVGCLLSRVRIVTGAASITRFEDKEKRTARNFCALCGTPLFYERAHSPQMLNIPRAPF